MPAPAPLFICDSMLGRLAKNLRMLGFDTLYARQGSAETLCGTALLQHRILLTRRTGFLQKAPGRNVVHIFIRSDSAAEQVREVITGCSLKKTDVRPFTICLHCNARLAPVAREAVLSRVPEYVAATVDNFTACPLCGRVYWKGTHYARMTGGLDKIMGHGAL
jgi:uncharacterized protein